jgi:hypothetical protein
MPATVICASEIMPPKPPRNVSESAISPSASACAPIW